MSKKKKKKKKSAETDGAELFRRDMMEKQK